MKTVCGALGVAHSDIKVRARAPVAKPFWPDVAAVIRQLPLWFEHTTRFPSSQLSFTPRFIASPSNRENMSDL